jgi:hypothetical protein
VLTQPTLLDYAVARFLRLFPALLATCVFIAFLLGPLVTPVSWQIYFADPRTWLFVPLTASLVSHSMTLRGLFEALPEAGAIDPRSGPCVMRSLAASRDGKKARSAVPDRPGNSYLQLSLYRREVVRTAIAITYCWGPLSVSVAPTVTSCSDNLS